MSRLTDLLRELGTREPALARDLEREVTALADRRAFGLNFERHEPEAVELPGRKVRKGDKVRVLPQRGQMPKKTDEKLWRVIGIDRSTGKASLESFSAPALDSGHEGPPAIENRTAPLENLVVVAEFRDPIYPGLVSTGKVERGGDKPFHTVINAENFHALETLLFTHRGKVDAIYIDPPYNTGDKDWKYNNDYVESDDLYRHSKWLAMMERRLRLAKELLNPMDSVLIVAIDEKEYLRLGLLLEQTFPEALNIQMVTTVIKPEGTGRRNEFSRTNEFLFFVMFGEYRLVPTDDDMVDIDGQTDNGQNEETPIEWRNLRRRERESIRGARPNQFYAIFVDNKTGRIHSVGDVLGEDVPRASVKVPKGCTAHFPLSGSTEMLWSVIPERMRYLASKGYARFNGRIVQFLNSGTVAAIERGEIQVTGYDDYGGVIASYAQGTKAIMPKTVWVKPSHNAQASGSLLLKALIGDRVFPFPKSVYAVEYSLRFFISSKPNAVVIDFFSGSGTTAHAVMRLNKQDDGKRISISVTNNEVAPGEQKALREKGLRPGDPDWEQWGICEYITKPRIRAAITGRTPDGKSIKGDYRFIDEFPMAEGFQENVEFFSLTYEAPLRVASNREFAKIAPLLWIRAGSRGRSIDDIAKGWDVADAYGVLADLDKTEAFLKKVALKKNIAVAYIVTDDDRLFESIAQELPDHIEPVRLYEAYLRNFEIESGRGVL